MPLGTLRDRPPIRHRRGDGPEPSEVVAALLFIAGILGLAAFAGLIFLAGAAYGPSLL